VACTQTAPVVRTAYVELEVLVTAPSPQIYNVQVDTGKVKLDWYKLPSNYNVVAYHIYSKFGNGSIGSPSCSPGNPPNSGYTWIGAVGGNVSSYVDDSVWMQSDGTTGNYFVTAVLDNCVESVVDSAVSRSLVNGLEEVPADRSSYKVFPSPFSNELVIVADNHLLAVKAEVKIYSADGKLVYCSHQKSLSSLRIGTSEFEKGLYIVEITSSGRSVQQKAIKQ
jgi:hypothetical protein